MNADDHNQRILIVEDEGLIAADIQRRLQRLGYPPPSIATSGEEALARVRAAPFDLILMDIRLQGGGLDGIATAQILKAEFRAPLVYITAHADLETISRAKLTEPLAYLLKPITDGDLRSTVQVAIYKHQMERRVRASEAWLWTTLRSVGDPILATDSSGDVVFLNPQAEQLTGWTQSDAYRLPLTDILTLRDESTGQPANPVLDLLPHETRSYTLVSHSGDHTVVEVSCFENRGPDTHKDGEKDSGEPLGAVLVIRDVQSRRDAQARLVQSQRMDAISNFAAGLAEDFTNKVTIISGYAAELASCLCGQPLEDALQIQQAASALAATAAALLTLGRRAPQRLEVIDLHSLLIQTLGGSPSISLNLGSPQPFVRADRNHLRQSLLALTTQATRLQTELLNSQVRIRITHSGAAEDLYLFEPHFTKPQPPTPDPQPPFFPPDPQPPFSPLSQAHSLLTQSAAALTASPHGFEILLPSIGALHALPDAPTVLLVENEDTVRTLVHDFLDRGGYQVLEARTAEDAAAIAQVHAAPIHILVTDVALPGISGQDLAQRLAPLHPGLKALFISGYRHHTLEHESLWKDGLNLLPKPFPASELLRRVEVLLAQ